MKIAVVSLVSLLIGIGTGWYLGYTRPNAQANRELRKQLGDAEVDDITAAAFAVGAINRIDAGNTAAAVQWLSLPITRFWSDCHIRPSTNEQRLKLLAVIEKLSHTNQIVAAHITEKAAYLDSLEKQMERAEQLEKK
jgi:hypothetical protein